MRDQFRAWLGRLLPWYSPAEEALHDELTEAIRVRSIKARIRAEGERDRIAVTLRNTVHGVRGR